MFYIKIGLLCSFFQSIIFLFFLKKKLDFMVNLRFQIILEIYVPLFFSQISILYYIYGLAFANSANNSNNNTFN